MSGGDSLCLVFDAEINDIINRAKKIGKIKLPEEEIETFIKNKLDSAIWPNFTEGWTDIIYMCSFDSEESKNYIKKTVRKTKDVI